LKLLRDIRPIKVENYKLLVLNQLKLPFQEEWLELKDYLQVAKAIKDMIIRGAPLIGIVGAYGFAMGIKQYKNQNPDSLKVKADQIYNTLINSRPTAVNLSWALDRMTTKFKNLTQKGIYGSKLVDELFTEAKRIDLEDFHANKAIGGYGEVLIKENSRILTHCNTGALATSGWGTALGVIRTAYENEKNIFVYVDETRPYLQGSRLTAWELLQEGIPYQIIVDSCAGFLMKQGKIDAVIVGADRITLNGDVANKIGTYSLSVLAKQHNIPFYVAAPTSSFDLNLEKGEDIIIEIRDKKEITHCGNCPVAPQESDALNLSFDITPAENISTIITERGLITEVNREKILKFFNKS